MAVDAVSTELLSLLTGKLQGISAWIESISDENPMAMQIW
jgi:hypothetical protein